MAPEAIGLYSVALGAYHLGKIGIHDERKGIYSLF